MIAQLKEQLAEQEVTLRSLETPIMQEDSDRESVSEQSPTLACDCTARGVDCRCAGHP